MQRQISRRAFCLGVAAGVGGAILAGARQAAADIQPMVYLPNVINQGESPLNVAAPAQTTRLIFIHHSTGQNWLADDNGRLGLALRDNNYFVSDTNYGWGPDSIGSSTDIGHWYNWFLSGSRASYMAALYAESGKNSSYSRLAASPGGENDVILFKSCFPNSTIYGSPGDAPAVSGSAMYGDGAGSSSYTVANVKGLYRDLLVFFATQPNKLFVLIAPPPLVSGATDSSQAANARAVNNWLVSDWLSGYALKNVAIFDFFTVLTSNGGNANTNDAGAAGGNHHRYRGGAVEHITAAASNYSAYGSGGSDSHPTPAGGQKASAEFLPLLNIAYHRWKGG